MCRKCGENCDAVLPAELAVTISHRGKCRKCHADIEWARTASGKSAPLDAEPIDGGNILLHMNRVGEPGLVEILTGKKLKESRLRGEKLFINHFATCPFAAHFKKGKPKSK